MISSLIVFGVPYSLYKTCKILSQDIIETIKLKILLKYWSIYSLTLSFIYLFGFVLSWIPFIREFIVIFIVLIQSKDKLCIEIFDTYILQTFTNHKNNIETFKDNIYNNLFLYFQTFLTFFVSILVSKVKNE